MTARAMRFLADMGVDVRAVAWLRQRGHDAVHLREEGLHRMTDSDIFAKVAHEGRTILIFDLDFSEISALAGAGLPSLIVFRIENARYGNVITRLNAVLSASRQALEDGAIVTVEQTRHRVRRLPIK